MRPGTAVTLMIAGLVLAAAWWLHNRGFEAGRVSGIERMASVVQQARDQRDEAIAVAAVTVGTLRENLASCESTIVVNQVFERAALAAHAGRIKALERDKTAALGRLEKTLAGGSCAAWAAEASCIE